MQLTYVHNFTNTTSLGVDKRCQTDIPTTLFALHFLQTKTSLHMVLN